MAFRPNKIGDFLEAAYRLDIDDQAWLVEVMRVARTLSGESGPVNGTIYDASDVTAFRPLKIGFVDASPEVIESMSNGLRLHTPAVIVRTFRCVSADRFGAMKIPELRPMLDALTARGYADAIHVNGLDASGLGTYIGIWIRRARALPAGEMAVYRRMAHHLGAASRCRRRLYESQPQRAHVDPTQGAEAILDTHQRVVHAEGAAKEKGAQSELREMSRARELARKTSADAEDGLRRWHPLTSARWTLVDSFERGGARYVVARENQSQVPGLSSFSDRERQVVAYLALGQSTKETAYALGISDVTVRVLIGRAATKLGVRSRAALLAHPEVRSLRPGANTVQEEEDDAISSRETR